MSKDKDDKDNKDNVIKFPTKQPDESKVLLFTGKNIEELNEFNTEEMEIIDSFTLLDLFSESNIL